MSEPFVCLTHCFHRANMVMYTSWPPQWDEVCCHCGTVERRQAPIPSLGPDHGPHAPAAGWGDGGTRSVRAD